MESRNTQACDHLQLGCGWRNIRIVRLVALGYILCLVWIQSLKNGNINAKETT